MAGKRPRHGARRRAYSQNFLADPAVAERIVRAAGVRRGELVVEIGAGGGMLTRALARTGARVLAIEIDDVWASRLRERLSRFPNVEVVHGDARDVPLPGEPVRVVANLPFGATTDLLRRLLDDPASTLTRADVLLQWEVARKRAGRPGTLVSAAWSPWWRFRLGQRIPNAAFRPRPAVDAGVLVVERRAVSLLPPAQRDDFAAFVEGVFSGGIAAGLDARTWAALYGAYSAAAAGDPRSASLD